MMTRCPLLLAFSLLLLGLLAVPVLGQHADHGAAGSAASDRAAAAGSPQDHSQHMQHMQHQTKGAVEAKNVSVDIHDLELLTDRGERVRFASDVLRDRLVAMTFTYTTCTTVCPIYGALFRKVQDQLGDRLGDEMILVTITLDPSRDVPPRMRREAEKFAAKPGWYHLTGKKANVDEVLRGLDAYFADFTQHPPMALVGDAAAGTWKRFNGFPPPAEIVAALDELAAARTDSGGE